MLSFQAYKHISESIYRSKKIQHIADHTFLVLEWNLISQADYCVGVKVEHISFHRDVPLFGFAETKTDKEGIKKSTIRGTCA